MSEKAPSEFVLDVVGFGKFYVWGLARIWLMMGFGLFSLLVENPFVDYYVGLHLQNDLCCGCC